MKSPITSSPHHEMIQCPREGDVLDALSSARWPARVDAELTTHVASCEVCQDVIAVASAMRDDHDAAWHEASVPSSGQMWWRAEMRARQDAIREATRPVAIAQAVAAGLALAVAIGAGWLLWPTVPAISSPIVLPLAIAMGALLVVAPVALYVVLSEKP